MRNHKREGDKFTKMARLCGSTRIYYRMRSNDYVNMEKKRWAKIEPILDKALSIEKTKERREFVHQTCENDKLEGEILKMLSYIRQAEEEGFLE